MRSEADLVEELATIGKRREYLSEEDVRDAIKHARALFRAACRRANYDDKSINAVLTKFVDAGRRSAPWRPVSSRVPGRPQDGADGNRILRWKLPKCHKFYATEIDATLVEIKYIFQALSMTGAPVIESRSKLTCWAWLCPQPAQPGTFLDPIRLIGVDFERFVDNRRLITSGHLDPLDRTGSHKPDNTSLMLKMSNDLQGNLRIDELLDQIWEIVCQHENLLGWTRPDRR